MVPIYEDSLRKVRNIFDEPPSMEKRDLPSFQTARGKSVKISEDSLTKTRRIIDELPLMKNRNLPSFQTASGKTVNISEDSLVKVRQTVDELPVIENFPLSSFQTASGKNVNISKDSLSRTKQIFDEESFMGNSQLPTFETESCQTVKVPENSLNKFRRIFDKQPLTENTTLPCFQTASGKNVKISDDSLNKVRQIFDEELCIENAPLPCLETVSNTTIKTSKDSVKNTRNSFDKDPLIKDNNFVHQLPNGDPNFVIVYSNNSKIEHSHSKARYQIIEPNLSEKPNSLETNVHEPKEFPRNGELPTAKNLPVVIECLSSSPKMDIDSIKEKAKISSRCKLKVDDQTIVKYNVPPNNFDVCPNKKPIKIPRKLFEDTSSNEMKIKNFHSIVNENSSIYSSVISEEDLSLLNKSVMNVTDDFATSEHNISNIKSNSEMTYLSPRVAREISESMAALIADEESDSPLGKSWSFKPVISSPTTLERNIRLPSIDCDDKEMSLNDTPLSPVLDSLHSIKSKKLFKKNINASLNSYVSHELQHSSTPLSSTSSFKPPYATSTPNEVTVKGKLKRSLDESLEKEAKRIKCKPERTTNKLNEENYKIGEMRRRSAEEQDSCIKNKMKSRKSIKSCKGSFLIRTHTEKRRSLQNLANNAPLKSLPANQLLDLGVKKAVVEVTGYNALDFKFSKDFFSEETSRSNVKGVPVGDGALLILDAEGQAGVREVTRAFLASPSIDPALASADWVHNHFRWLVIKMAATERMFPLQLANRYLTPNNLLLQLKYRYDREIDRCQRPILRKILEKDESASKPMVLFVADIFKVETGDSVGKRQSSSSVELELSDGWYSVRTSVDHEMNQLIEKNLVMKGTKLMIVGAELINNEDGCHPLETPAAVRLKVSTNSCRRVRWFTRLGVQPRSLPPLSLASVLARGGSIASLAAVVARRYPLLFMEKLPEGKSVVRGERAELTAADKHQHQRQVTAETVLSQLQCERERSKRQSRTPVTRRQLQQVSSTQELCRLLDDVDDITLLQDALSKEQLESLQEYKQEEAVKAQQQLQDRLVKELDEKLPPRVVTRMLKVRLADFNSDHSAILTLWNPSEQVLDLLVEGHHLVFHNLTASGHSRFGDLQLTGGRHTKFVLEKNCVSSRPRSVTLLPELQCSDFKPQFSEIDVVGLVLPQDASSDNPRLFYLANADYHFLAVSLSIDLKEAGFSSVISAGKLVAVSNLMWHSRLVTWSLPIAHATEITFFSQHPRLSHLQQALDDLAHKIKLLDLETYMSDCLERIQSLKAHRDSAGTTPLKQLQGSSAASVNKQLNTSIKMLPLLNRSKDSSNSKTSVSVCDNDTPSNRKLSWLEQFGEPPPLSPLSLSTPSRVKRNFHPPKKRPLEDK